MLVKILGSAAGGGFPQWNCGCSNCAGVRSGLLKGRPRTQAQVAVSATGERWVLLNASPDLRQHLLQYQEFAPPNRGRGTPIGAIVLLSADADCVMGLLHLREFQPLRIFATPSVLRILTEDNSLFRVLERSTPPVEWIPLALDEPVRIDAGLCCRAMPLGGDFPDYVTPALRNALHKDEAVVALELSQEGRRMLYAPSLPELTENCKDAIAHADLSLLDGTFWTDCELAHVTGNKKTAREIGHVPLSGKDGLLEQLRDAKGGRKVLIHMNNTNPVLNEESAASQMIRDSGWNVAYDGMEFQL